MTKIIIHNDSTAPNSRVLGYVAEVMYFQDGAMDYPGKLSTISVKVGQDVHDEIVCTIEETRHD